MMDFIIRWLQLVICPPIIPKEPKPEIEILEIPCSTMAMKLAEDTGVELLYGYLDSKYYYCFFEDWGKIFNYIYTVEDIPEHISQRFDCENWALWLQQMVAYHFGLNAFAMVIGSVPQGRHGFNMFYAEDGWWLFEPQDVKDGKPFRIGERNYLPKFALI